MTEAEWGELFAAAARSPNRVRQVGVRLDCQSGDRLFACDTWPPGVRDLEERHEGDGRFVWMEHAERNALLQAARRGIATEGATLATTFFPCIDCARAIAVAGVARVITPEPAYEDPVWGEAFQRSRLILEEAALRLDFVPFAPSNEELWRARAED